MKYVELPHSHRPQPPEARRLRTKPDSRDTIHVTVIVRSRSAHEARSQAIREITSQHPGLRKHLDSNTIAQHHGATREDLNLVKSFAVQNGLRVVDESVGRRCVVLSGTLANFGRAFKVEFASYQHQGQIYRTHHAAVQVPLPLDEVVEAVLGLENRILMQHHAFASAHHASSHVNPKEVAERYAFPAHADGRGQTVAIIELGGGFYKSDLDEYFRSENLRTPEVSVIGIEGEKNDPATPEQIKQMLDLAGLSSSHSELTGGQMNSADAARAMWTVETTLDIQMTAAFANGAKIVVYFAPNNAQGKYHALTSALHNEKEPPSVISCSWGAVEDTLPMDFVRSMDRVFQDAALLGVSICFSSGDRGEDPDPEGSPRVHFPASSPYVLSCGGTHWIVSPKKLKEVVWNEALPKSVVQSGGGVSKIFDRPEWQNSNSGGRVRGSDLQAGIADFKGRGVPDVAGKADMATGYRMFVGGQDVTMGGTSSVAPMWAGLIARLNQELGKPVGFLSPFLYEATCRAAFNDVTEGNIGPHFHAEPGWDACTGWGTPNGIKLLAALKSTGEERK